MIPTWAVFVIVVVLVVGYYLLSTPARQRRRQSVAADFAKLPNFHANQTFTDMRGESAIGIDDRGRRIAAARRDARPRTKLYSFAHIVSAELLQNGVAIASITRLGQGPERRPDPVQPESSLFGSTGRVAPGMPAVKAAQGPLEKLAVRVVFQDAVDSGLLVRFYEGKAVALESVAGERAFADARACMGALDVAIKRAALPPRPATIQAAQRVD
jgi:hypothetical protein